MHVPHSVTGRTQAELMFGATYYDSLSGRTPAKLMFGRAIRPKFSLLRSSLRKTVEERQRQQRNYCKGHDSPRMKERSFSHGEKVAIFNKQRGTEKLMQRTAIEAKELRNYVHHTNARPEQNGAC